MRDKTKRQKMETNLDINSLFKSSKKTTPFSMASGISPQLKAILKAQPDYVVRYEKKSNVSKAKAATKLLKSMRVVLRGVGFTRKDKSPTNKQRKMAKSSRRINRNER